MKHRTFSYLLAILPLIFFASTVHVKQVSAQQGGNSGITITPPRFETFGNPGDTLSEQVRVKNDSDTPQSYSIVIQDFTSTGEEGYVALEEPSTTTAYSLAKWIEPSVKDITLQPHEEQAVSFTIYIPKDAEPGGHYASVLFQTGSPDVKGAANVVQRIGTLILLRVSGNVTEKASIESFDAPKFSPSGPVAFDLRIKNEGNVHVRPTGTIVITNMFGKKVEEIPLNGANVLPGAIRKMDTTWDKTNLLGQYTATLVASYGQQNLPLTAAVKFTVASPTSIILIGIAGIASIVFILSLISGRSRLLKALGVLFGR